VGSADMVRSTLSSPVLSSMSFTVIEARPSLISSRSDCMEHYDWSKHATQVVPKGGTSPSLLPSPAFIVTQKYGRRKRESFVGLTTRPGTVRAKLRKKFSWKQYPEVSSTLNDVYGENAI
jgi:hypothetical protein